MEITHCLADAKHIRRFLDACDGNWHHCIYVECANCRVKNPCNTSGFLFCPDHRAVPLVLPHSDASILFACRPEPEECLAVFNDSAFLEMSDGKLMETQTANYFSDIYPIDCAVLSANA